MAFYKLNTKIITTKGLKLIQDLSEKDYVFDTFSNPVKISKIIHYSGKINNVISNRKNNIYLRDCDSLFLKKTTTNRFKEDTVNISLNMYSKQFRTFKHVYKLYITPLELRENEIDIDPYFLGLLLGDGNMKYSNIGITTMDKEIIDEIYNQANKLNLKIRITGIINSKASTYHFSDKFRHMNNELMNMIKSNDLYGKSSGDKFIPNSYLFNGKQNRLSVLAGLLDTDGSKGRDNNYDYISKSKQLANDITFLSRTLGFRATMTECKKGCQTGAVGTYYRVSICCNENIIPVRLERKKSQPRKQKKNVRVFGFNIEETFGDFIGLSVGGDNTYINNECFVVCGAM